MNTVLALALAALAAADLAVPLTEAQRAKAQSAVAAMRASKRGPYSGILWFCNDGTQQPPKLKGCVERGGGVMYGTLSPDAERLAKLGIHVGTILTALTADDLAADDFYRARALVIERYLERALGGWVLEQAKTFRGFRQDEDEAESARRHLLELAGTGPLLDRGRLVLGRLTRALPYGRGGEALADEIRGLAAQIGDADANFADVRFKIHALPEPTDVAAVDAYAEGRPGELGDKARSLAAAMRRYYDPASRLERLRAVRQWIGIRPMRDAIDAFLAADPGDSLAVIERGAALIEAVGGPLAATTDPRAAERNLLRVHLISIVEELWVGVSADLARRPLSRRVALEVLGKLVKAATAAGMLSPREQDQARGALAAMATSDAVGYARHARGFGRVLEWARARVGFELGLPLARYLAVEPRSAFVVDDILRSGVMLPLATLYDRVLSDAEALAGGGHRLLGISAPVVSLRGENPGLALGPLRVVAPGGDRHNLERGSVALLHELPPDLPPVAGVLTVGAPGSLSHVALLARNLGIPLAAVGGEVAEALVLHAGAQVVLGVSPGRRVLLGLGSALDPAERASLAQPASAPAPRGLLIDDGRLDLTTTRILRLDEVSEADAGVRVGPKAAELGRLKRLFPERVSDAAVIPFGAFARHVEIPGAGGEAPLAALRAAYGRFAAARADAARAPAAEAEMLAALARFRAEVLTRPFAPGFAAEVQRALEALGKPGGFGVFVRSDTNVEDLKDFTGAGLNLTVPNRVAVRDILQAIREVWASPFTERSFRWRQQLLENPEHVYPSVLLHRTVPSEVSGVLVTTDLETFAAGSLSVSAGEGVAAVVDGGAPETVVVESSGAVRLLSSSRSPTRKVIPRLPAQGVSVEPAAGKDPLLTEQDFVELRRLADEVRARIAADEAGVPWDIEFGLWRKKAYLMQIRPLKVSRAAGIHPLLADLDRHAAAPGAAVALDEALR